LHGQRQTHHFGCALCWPLLQLLHACSCRCAVMRNIIPRARLGLLTSLSRVHLTVPRKCTAAKVRCPVVVVCRLLFLLHLIVQALLDGDLSHIASKCQVSFEDKFKKCVHTTDSVHVFLLESVHLFSLSSQCRKRSESSQSAVRSHDLCCRLVATRAPQSSGRHYRMRLHLDWW
jgi:hypothetical protein